MKLSVNSPTNPESGAPPGTTLEAETNKGPFSMPEIRISVMYVLLASVWIIASDMIVEYREDGWTHGWFVQSIKGLNFVFTTGVLLFLVLRRAFGGWRHSEEMRFAGLSSARERYRRLSSRVQHLREEERTKISREIHDELGQLLTGIKMQLRLTEDRLANRDDRSLNPVIDDLIETSGMIDETIASVKRISSGLRPAALDHLGLGAALDEEAENFSRRTGIKVNLRLGELDGVIPANVETTAFRIFQESLTNVARHAKAREVTPECTIRGGVLTLKVRDDGVGIDPDVVENPASLGLVGMLERAADAGGKVDFKSSSMEGTEVVLTIPIEDRTKLAHVS